MSVTEGAGTQLTFPRSIDTVLFDAFNTLWRPSRPVADMWAEVLDQFDAVRTPREIINAVAAHQLWMAPQVLSFESSGRPVDDDTNDALWTEFDGRVLRYLGVDVSDDTVVSNVLPIFNASNLALYDDTVEVLESIQSIGYRTAIVSNGVYQQRAAVRLGILAYFETIIGSWHVGFMKPDPEIFKMALQALGVTAEQALKVGDTWDDDVKGARSLRIRTLHLRRGETVDESRGEISSLFGVIELLDNHGKHQARKY